MQNVEKILGKYSSLSEGPKWSFDVEVKIILVEGVCLYFKHLCPHVYLIVSPNKQLKKKCLYSDFDVGSVDFQKYSRKNVALL